MLVVNTYYFKEKLLPISQAALRFIITQNKSFIGIKTRSKCGWMEMLARVFLPSMHIEVPTMEAKRTWGLCENTFQSNCYIGSWTYFHLFCSEFSFVWGGKEGVPSFTNASEKVPTINKLFGTLLLLVDGLHLSEKKKNFGRIIFPFLRANRGKLHFASALTILWQRSSAILTRISLSLLCTAWRWRALKHVFCKKKKKERKKKVTKVVTWSNCVIEDQALLQIIWFHAGFTSPIWG